MGDLKILLLEPAKTVFTQMGQFLVNVLLVIIILIIGWIIAKLIKTVVTKALRIIRLDELSSRVELDNLLAKGGINYSLSELIGVLCYWVALLVTFVVAVNAVGLTIAADLLNRIVLYIPNVIAAIFILILGMFFASLLKSFVQTAANNAGVAQSNFLAQLVNTVVIIFAIAIAMEQLNIGAKIIELTVTVILGSLGLGLALAFGLGCKDVVGRYVADFLDKFKKK
jgi:hypothetical protein